MSKELKDLKAKPISMKDAQGVKGGAGPIIQKAGTSAGTDKAGTN